MDDIKYIGVQGLEELIILTKNGLANKADTLQFDIMPDPIKYIGKVVQYVGVSDVSFTRSHFYYSNGIKWTEENISGDQATQIEMVTALPSWVNADPQILYILKDALDKKMSLYVKNPSVNDSWFTVESSGSFAVVATLPQWGDADSSTIYFKADGNILTGYIKKTGTIGAWYTVGGAGSEIIVDSALSASSTNPVQNKVIYAAIQDVLAQVASIYHYKGSCLAADLPMTDNTVGDTWNVEDASSYGPPGTNVAWDGTEWDALGGDLTPDAVPTEGSQHTVMSGGVYDALLTKENADNKVTTIDATATDGQYPSAKAVYDALEDLEPIPPGFVQNVDTTMQPVEDGKVMRISKTAFDALAQRDPNIMYYLDEEHDIIDAKPTCRDTDGNLIKGQKIVELTKGQYDALAEKDPDTYYMINDDSGKDYSMLGAVQGFLITPTDKHWLLADGSSVDAKLHPRLAAVMPKLPDLRECVLVGAGKNKHNSIATHDVYDVGQFKDDQFKSHNHSAKITGGEHAHSAKTGTDGPYLPTVAPGGHAYFPTHAYEPTSWEGHTHDITINNKGGETTHGKQVGVLFYVWAD